MSGHPVVLDVTSFFFHIGGLDAGVIGRLDTDTGVHNSVVASAEAI